MFPEYPANLLAIAEALQKLGRNSEAREHFRRAYDNAVARQSADPDTTVWSEDARRAL